MSENIERHGIEAAEIEGKKITENIFLCSDGKYRWVYEYSMLKNPVILSTIFKVLLIAALIVTGFVMILNLINGNLGFAQPSDMEKTGLTVAGIAFLACVLIAYLVVAKSKGFKYCVLFEMDEKSITHKELAKSFKKTQALSALTFLAGLAANRPGVAGAGLLAAVKNELSSAFSKVKRIKALKAFHTIKLDSPMNHNQIYAEPEDYDFVLEFIRTRVSNT
ncbi:MAG: hypothetical protein MJ085_06335 [Clostridia bacterium]|nr:hypothetical protein [Clostridia bacterium]